jgi:hypothetical protein
MSSNGKFSTYTQQKQVELAQKLMDRFKGNERGYGWADPKGAYLDTVKNKWRFKEGCLGWKWGAITLDQWIDHLSGVRMLGIGPIRNDFKCYWGCIDVDNVGEYTKYDFDVVDVVKRAKQTYRHFVPVRSKSGGVHLFLHFKEPVEAKWLIDTLYGLMARIGIAGNEVFPKQQMLAEEDAPSWVFMPYFGG